MKHSAYICIDDEDNDEDDVLFQIITFDTSIMINMTYNEFAQILTGLSRVEVVYSIEDQEKEIIRTNLTGFLTISKDNHDIINIVLIDKNSRLPFVTTKLTMHEFGRIILKTGMDTDVEIENIEFIGKIKVQEQRTAECPLKSYEWDLLQDWLIKNCQEDGYTISSYLGSQNSIVWKDDVTYLHYNVYKYI